MLVAVPQRNSLGLILLFLLHFALIGPTLVLAESSSLSQDLSGLIAAKGSPTIGISVVDVLNGHEIFSFQDHASLKPASVLKLVITSAALRDLGPEYRFTTTVLGRIEKGTVAKLYIVGGADPSLNIESLWLLTRALKKRGLRKVGDIFLSSGEFSGAKRREGQRAYLTGSAGLSFNYNSVGFDICPDASGGTATVSADPWESGVVIEGSVKTVAGAGRVTIDELGLKKGLPAYRVGGTVGKGEGCVQIFRSVPDPVANLGRTIRGFLNELGISVTGTIGEGEPLGNEPTIYEHRSKPLVDILRDLNHFSNNFIAEQVLLTLDPSGSRESGLRSLTKHLLELGIAEEEFNFADSSGLSHNNRVSARAITKLLQNIQGEEGIKPEFEVSLSVADRNGTLKRRNMGGLVRGKTGSINGVCSLAGYLTSRSGRKLAFAILQNDISSLESARAFEDKLVSTLFAKS